MRLSVNTGKPGAVNLNKNAAVVMMKRRSKMVIMVKAFAFSPLSFQEKGRGKFAGDAAEYLGFHLRSFSPLARGVGGVAS